MSQHGSSSIFPCEFQINYFSCHIGLTKFCLKKLRICHQLIGKFILIKSFVLMVKTYFNGKDIFIINEKSQIRTYTGTYNFTFTTNCHST